MTLSFYTGLRIISSVIHQCVRAAVKGLSFGFVIVAGTEMCLFRAGIVRPRMFARSKDFKAFQRAELPINGLSKITNPSTSPRRSAEIGGQCSMTRR